MISSSLIFMLPDPLKCIFSRKTIFQSYHKHSAFLSTLDTDPVPYILVLIHRPCEGLTKTEHYLVWNVKEVPGFRDWLDARSTNNFEDLRQLVLQNQEILNVLNVIIERIGNYEHSMPSKTCIKFAMMQSWVIPHRRAAVIDYSYCTFRMQIVVPRWRISLFMHRNVEKHVLRPCDWCAPEPHHMSPVQARLRCAKHQCKHIWVLTSILAGENANMLCTDGLTHLYSLTY